MLWLENINVVLDVVLKLVVGVVWVNGINMFDVVVFFGGVCESGYGCEGGWEGFVVYIKLKIIVKFVVLIVFFMGDGVLVDLLDCMVKFYIGGK